MALTRNDILQALARAYTRQENSKKALDVTLVQAMADEVMRVIDRLLEQEIQRR